MSRPRLFVFCCVVGTVSDDVRRIVESVPDISGRFDVSLVLYTDRMSPGTYSPGAGVCWHVQPPLLPEGVRDPIRIARFHKLLSHNTSPDADYSLWFDGCLAFKPGLNLAELVDQSLQHDRYSLATFRHPDRTCFYQEAIACLRLRKDSATKIHKQVDHYSSRMPPNLGLTENAVVIRRHTQEIREFNEFWWEQLSQFSRRDQLSFPYCAYVKQLEYGIIPGRRDNSTFFDYVGHITKRPAGVQVSVRSDRRRKI